MSLKFLVLFVFVISQVSCEKRGSLAFVIDDTMSMGDDILNVKNFTKSNSDYIFNVAEDVVVVTFNDPETKLITRTQNPDELAQALDSIQANNGGDCPEMALSGIKLALEETQSYSNLYVFTDASAKDYKKFDEVKTLCQEKHSKITFFLTEMCGLTNPEMNMVYDNLAKACNGEVLRIFNKDELKQALEYAKVKASNKNIATAVFPSPNLRWGRLKFFKTDSVSDIMVVASGTAVELDIVDQEKMSVLGKGIQIIWSDDNKIVTLKDLPNGQITVKVKSTSDVIVFVSGKPLETNNQN